METWYVYMLQLSNGAFYTGITNSIENRMKMHEQGKGSKIVRSFRPFYLVYVEKAGSRSAASKREAEIKKMERFTKFTLCCSNDNLVFQKQWKTYTSRGAHL